MAIELIDKIKPKNNGSFPMVDAADVEMPDGSRLSEFSQIPGDDGITPHIGDNGNWYLGDTDTGKPSRGEKGEPGQKGSPGADGEDGYTPVKGTDYFTDADKQEIVDAVKEGIEIPSAEIPTFDLGALGLSAVGFPVGSGTLDVDTTSIIEAASKGPVRFGVPVSTGDAEATLFIDTITFSVEGRYLCSSFISEEPCVSFAAMVTPDNVVTVNIAPLSQSDGLPSGTDGQMLQNVGGTWTAVSVADSAIGTYIDDYIAEALGGEY